MEHELKVWEGITAKLNSKDEQAKVLLQNCQNEYSDICTKGYLQTKTEISNASENLKHSKDFEVEKLAEKVHELVEITKQDYESEFNQKIADLNPKLETALRTLAESEKRMNKTNEKYALQNPTLISISEWQGYIRELEEEIRDIRDKISQSNAMDLNE
uniref:Nsp1_C domain-containing protein n=1 Tax=Rhabditophanes sp. KR3021 TaxID=114890 RepID=A0AC35TU23_9BILA